MIARSKLVNPKEVEVFHCYSRCARRARLCGGEFEHRRFILESLIRKCANFMAVDLGSYGILDNHFHLILRTRPDIVRTWSDLEVARRWFSLYAPSLRDRAKRKRKKPSPWLADVDPSELSDDEVVIRTIAGQTKFIKKLRKRLSSISWFNKYVKEALARLANREDGVTGCFWDGRFKSPKLTCDEAVLAAMVYVDLNVIRAGLAATLESSDCTSIQERIQLLQWSERLSGRSRTAPPRAKEPFSLTKSPDSPGHSSLAPIQAGDGGPSDRGMLQVTLEEYISIVDQVGRVVRPDKRGAIPADLPPILDRLGIDSGRMVTEIRHFGDRVGSVVGTAASLAHEAARRGVKYVLSEFDVAPRPATAPSAAMHHETEPPAPNSS